MGIYIGCLRLSIHHVMCMIIRVRYLRGLAGDNQPGSTATTAAATTTTTAAAAAAGISLLPLEPFPSRGHTVGAARTRLIGCLQ